MEEVDVDESLRGALATDKSTAVGFTLTAELSAAVVAGITAWPWNRSRTISSSFISPADVQIKSTDA